MRLSISNIGWSPDLDNAMYDYLNKQNFTGIEIAPTRIFPEHPYDNKIAAKRFATNLKDKYGLTISSMQSIWYGKTENMFGTEAERSELLRYTKKAIDFACLIGCRNVVFGCPQNRNRKETLNYTLAIKFFQELAAYAKEKETVIAMEPNPTIYHTNFINETAQAFELVKEVSSDGFKVNVDVGTIIQNQESLKVIEENISLVNHVHISEPFLEKIEKRDLHRSISTILHEKKYGGYVSIEMKNLNDLCIVKATMDYVKEVFA